jgi:hypothetical protein
VLPSSCSLIVAARAAAGEAVDAHAVGRIVFETAPTLVDTALQARKSLQKERFLDLDYNELVAEPLRAVKKVYEFCGARLSLTSENRMRSKLAKQRRHTPFHQYSLEQFGLCPKRIKKDFAPYIERFDLG